GVLGQCASTTTTQSSTTGSQDIPAQGSPNLTVSDTATINVSGVTSFNGTVSFFLCGPSQTALTICADGQGAAIGSAQTVTANGNKTSDTVTITSAGSYCWRAVFSGDANAGVPGSRDDGTNECFTVNPRSPTLTTQAGAGPVNFGGAVTDTATLGNLAKDAGTGGIGGGSINPTAQTNAGGTITFFLYGPSTSGCGSLATGFPTAGIVVDINNGGDGTYGG